MSEVEERDELGFVTGKGASYHRQEVLNALADVLIANSEMLERGGGTVSANQFLFRVAKKLRDTRRELLSRPKHFCSVCGGSVDSPGDVHDLCQYRT